MNLNIIYNEDCQETMTNHIEELKPNPKLIELIKNYTYKTKKGIVKVLLNTNLQFIEPTLYLITYPITLTILEYKVNEISNKPFYIKEYK